MALALNNTFAIGIVMLRKTPFFLAALMLILLSATSFGQSGTPYHYLIPIIDRLDTPAGRPVVIPMFLENQGATAVSLQISLLGDPSFSIDPTRTTVILDPGMKDMVFVEFMQTMMGSYQTILRVSDGTLVDTMTLTVDVIQGPGPFVILPPFQNLTAQIGVGLQIPMSILNLTSVAYPVSVQLHGPPEFSYSGASTISIPDSGSTALTLDFLATQAGPYTATLVVSDGTYQDSTTVLVYAFKAITKYVLPIMDDFETIPGPGLSIGAYATNPTAASVTLTSTITGQGFAIDPTSASLTLLPGQGDLIWLTFQSNTVGRYTGMLLTTDGVVTDSVEVVVNVIPGPGNFDLQPRYGEAYVHSNEPFSGYLQIQSYSANSQRLSVSIVGDPEFTLAGSRTFDLEQFGSADLLLSFMSTSPGVYTTNVMVTDGIETDTSTIVAYVDSLSLEFTLSYDGTPPFFLFEAPLNSSQSKYAVITNTSGKELTVQVEFFSDFSFTVDRRSVTLAAGAKDSVLVTFSNQYGYGDGMISFTTDNDWQDVYLIGSSPKDAEYDGLIVTSFLDFGIIDSTMTACLDVMIENTTPNAIPISDIALSGFSNSFFLTQHDNFSIEPGQFRTVTVCYHPLTANLVENEVLTFTFNNPASTPNIQTATVQITGRSDFGIKPIDSCGIIGYYVNTIAAPLDGQSETTIELFNITNQPITVENAVWEDGNNQGIYSLQTSLPFTIQPHSSSLPTSGKKEITIRYAPTSKSSTVGVPDMATLRLGSDLQNPVTQFLMTLIGLPVTPASPAGSIALFPKDNSIPMIELGNVEINTVRTLKFYNNLDVPVTISGYDLASTARFELVDIEASKRSVTLPPNETIELAVRTINVPAKKTTDQIIMNGTHAHLNSRYNLISGTNLTGVDGPNQLPGTFSLSAAPNPATGPVAFTFSSQLRESTVSILNALGQVIVEHKDVERYWQWDGRTAGGSAVDPGVYYVLVHGITLEGAPVSATQKLLIMK